MYWQSVINEIFNQYADDYPFHFTNVYEKHRNESDTKQSVPKEKPVKYILNKEKGWYLTGRELQCIMGFLDGQTIKAVALSLSLSPRTVEFYLKRIKDRFGCRTKVDLLNVISQFDLLKLRH
ncbi:helix-turn-helix transcriptional regulator [Gammaproteobacteria bacterium]|nr:helix-turn-helix transcriptional regulator [Gammaproteobacteria bacterium]